MTTRFFQISANCDRQDPAPAVRRVLADLDGLPLFHAEQGLRHPLGIYNQSLTKIGKRAVELLTQLSHTVEEELKAQSGSTKYFDELLEANDHFLDALIEHVDDCKAILKGVLGPDESYKVIAAFNKAIEPYRNHIGAIVNLIKHHQATFSPIQFSWPGNVCLGYFVATVNDGAVVAPSKIVHRDGSSGFSFNRDVPFHLCGIFFVGEQLQNQLLLSRPKLRSSSRVPLLPARTKAEGAWMNALQMAAQLPRLFFPDEVAMQPPLIVVEEDRVRLKYAPTPIKRAKAPPPTARISVSMSGDGVTKSFKMPYIGRK